MLRPQKKANWFASKRFSRRVSASCFESIGQHPDSVLRDRREHKQQGQQRRERQSEPRADPQM
jgi:hypothetical protein